MVEDKSIASQEGKLMSLTSLTTMDSKRIGVLLLVSAILVSSTLAQQTQPNGALEDPPWLKEFAHKRIVYSVPGMTRVRVRKNLVYKRVSGVDLKLDVYSPLYTRRGVTLSTNLTIEGVNHPTGHHGFDIEDNNERSREIIKQTIEFIQAHN
jgi:hypothetical protein